ncbi:zinc finger and SCAN domain-containing protein 2-like isoform X1 [Varanus komodoensis]|uniref:zinc finger and SCAN domain-containing protein 2-like isoform X1 n=1 Tax=Varanus komodoensis TaxID=61221 RepID=UPI001CF7BE1A|nr:zinc finger and SCAN domain-containing protein 2-like isoform X1 [Varanus komodoensis]
MAEQDSPGHKPWEKWEMRGRAPRVVQVGTIREFLPEATLAQVKQEPPEGLQQCWEAQWQELLKTMQDPHSGWKNPPLPQAWLKEETLEIQASGKEATDASQRPRGECVGQTLLGLSGVAQQSLDSVKAEGEIPEEVASSETQRQCFRQFCYWDAKGPREVCKQLQKLCRSWLKPERCSKEQMLELVTLEQFLAVLPPEMQSWVRDRGPETCAKAVAQAENFLTQLRELEGAEEKLLGPLEEVPVSSPKLECGHSDALKLQDFVGTKRPVDVAACSLEADGQVWKEETSLPEQVDNSGPSPGRTEGAPLHILEIDKEPGSQQGSGRHHEDHPGKAAKQTSLSINGNKSFRESTCPGGVYKHPTKTMVPDHGGNHHCSSGLPKHQAVECKEMPYTCIYCDKTFISTSQLIMHLRTRMGERPYEHLNCQKRFSHLLVSHERTHTAEEHYDCSECGKSFRDSSYLRKHQRIHMGKKPYSCTQCGKSFSQRSVLSRHKRTHREQKVYTCSDCGKGFCDKNSLSTHQRAHTGEKPFECSECGKRFGYASSLARHKKLHTGEKPFQCLECGKHLCDKKSLIMHKRTHTGEKPYTCSACGKNFHWKGSLLIHEKTHTGERPHQCSDCGKRFCDKRSLITHRRAHTGEKPYECSKCGKRFGYAPNLVRHKKLHTGEKPYQCLQCGKWFCQPSDLLRHETIHRQEKPHKCTDCDKSFSQKASLIGHRRTHTGEKPYKCTACEKRFCSFSGFRKHQKIHSGGKT